MTKKTLGLVLIVLGIVLLGISLAADQLGVGTAVGVMGWKQWTGTVVGALLFLAGIWLNRQATPPN
ncbi:MAG: hypothetical protein EHM33_14510 [Chloroflexi bacterium]|jgi:hypothetical protein|nr:MAG: hypothetical protein EHM33_14510 [Chloroflexota bacterium]